MCLCRHQNGNWAGWGSGRVLGWLLVPRCLLAAFVRGVCAAMPGLQVAHLRAPLVLVSGGPVVGQ